MTHVSVKQFISISFTAIWLGGCVTLPTVQANLPSITAFDEQSVADLSSQLAFLVGSKSLPNSSMVAQRPVYHGYQPEPFIFNCGVSTANQPTLYHYQFVETGIRFVPLTGETERLGYWQLTDIKTVDALEHNARF